MRVFFWNPNALRLRLVLILLCPLAQAQWCCVLLLVGRESVRAKQTHSGPKLRFGPAATTCAKASRQPVEGSI
jgi:hypothetical protein